MNDPVESAIIDFARTQPELGQARVAAELTRRGLVVSASGVRLIWQRHGLETTYKRIKAIAAKSERSRSRLTDRQARLLERGEVVARGERRERTRHRIVDDSDVEDSGVDRRLQILVAAAGCFARDGYEGASLRDIGSRIGLLPGSIYHHFPTKDELFLSVHRRGFSRLIDNVTRAIGGGSDAWQRLELACAEHIEALVEGDDIQRVTGATFFAAIAPKLKARLKPDRDRYEALFRKLVDDLDLPSSVDRTVFRLSVLGAINWTHVWYRRGGRTPRDIAHEIVALMRATRSADVRSRRR